MSLNEIDYLQNEYIPALLEKLKTLNKISKNVTIGGIDELKTSNNKIITYMQIIGTLNYSLKIAIQDPQYSSQQILKWTNFIKKVDLNEYYRLDTYNALLLQSSYEYFYTYLLYYESPKVIVNASMNERCIIQKNPNPSDCNCYITIDSQINAAEPLFQYSEFKAKYDPLYEAEWQKLANIEKEKKWPPYKETASTNSIYGCPDSVNCGSCGCCDQIYQQTPESTIIARNLACPCAPGYIHDERFLEQPYACLGKACGQPCYSLCRWSCKINSLSREYKEFMTSYGLDYQGQKPFENIEKTLMMTAQNGFLVRLPTRTQKNISIACCTNTINGGIGDVKNAVQSCSINIEKEIESKLCGGIVCPVNTVCDLITQKCVSTSCDSVICKNGGSCINGKCVCKTGVTGINCENDSRCNIIDCQTKGGVCDENGECNICTGCKNNGICETGKCNCTTGWTGKQCEQTIYEGVCGDCLDTQECINFECSDKVIAPVKTNNTVMIIGIVIGSLILLLILYGIYYYNNKDVNKDAK